MDLAIIDYGSGNLRSAAKAIERAAAEARLPTRVIVTGEAKAVAAADRIVLPGVGAFADCMRGLTALAGMIEALEEAVIRRARPFLGICVGMQLMATTGREHGDHPGLGWIPGDVVALNPADGTLKVPHMGWNGLRLGGAAHPVLAGLADDTHVCFVHSYHLRPDNTRHILARADHGGSIAAVIGRDNLVGTQFHPEKSQRGGLRLLSNFLTWRP